MDTIRDNTSLQCTSAHMNKRARMRTRVGEEGSQLNVQFEELNKDRK